MLEKMILAAVKLGLLLMAAILLPFLVGWIAADGVYEHFTTAESDHVRD